MPYTVKIKRQAKRKLRTLPRPERQRIAEKIHNLGLNPDDKELDVKNKERVEFLVEGYTYDYADPDWDTYTESYAGKSNAFVYILVLDRLANKKIVALFDYI